MKEKNKTSVHQHEIRALICLAACCTGVFALFSLLPSWEKHHAYAAVVETHRGITKSGARPTVTIDWAHPIDKASAMVPLQHLTPGEQVCVQYSLNRFDVPINVRAVFNRLCDQAGVAQTPPTIVDPDI